MVRIQPVRTRRDLKEFARFPNRLYHDVPQHVPNLISDEINLFNPAKNPAFAFCDAQLFLALNGSSVVGRIAAIVNEKAIEKFGEPRGRFGFVDFVDDPEVSEALFGAAEAWLHTRGIRIVQGPLGFSDLDEEGMLTEGFEEKGTLTTIYNHAYYPEHLKQLGYHEDVRWFEYEAVLPDHIDERMHHLAQTVRERYGLKIVPVKRARDVLPFAEKLFGLINTAYEDLYNITPLDEAQMQYYTKQYLTFVHPDYIKLIVDSDDNLISFGLCFPSLGPAFKKANGHLLPLGWWHILRTFKRHDRVEMLLIAVDPAYSRKGVPAILFESFIESFVRNGVRRADINPQLEDNVAVRNLWKNYETRQHRKRASFMKILND